MVEGEVGEAAEEVLAARRSSGSRGYAPGKLGPADTPNTVESRSVTCGCCVGGSRGAVEHVNCRQHKSSSMRATSGVLGA